MRRRKGTLANLGLLSSSIKCFDLFLDLIQLLKQWFLLLVNFRLLLGNTLVLGHERLLLGHHFLYRRINDIDVYEDSIEYNILSVHRRAQTFQRVHCRWPLSVRNHGWPSSHPVADEYFGIDAENIYEDISSQV